MNIGKTRIQAGAVTFALQHRDQDGGAPHSQGAGGHGGNYANQGVCVQVVADVNGKETEILRFDCFDVTPHYHYGPEKDNVRIMMDQTVTGNPLGWTIKQFRDQLPAMIKRAGYAELAGKMDTRLVNQKLNEVETTARDLERKGRHTVTHNRGTEVIEAGNIKFGLEMRAVGQDGGMAIHLLSDVAGQEIELIAFDYFRVNPHYHYGPRNRNERIFIDTSLVPDSLDWALDQFKSGNLPNMLERAGYPTIANELDRDLVAATLPRVEKRAKEMVAAATR